MHAAAACYDLHLRQSRSLKSKRAVIRPIVDGLRHRFHLSVAEVDHQNQWQRAAIAVAVVGRTDSQVRETLASVERFVIAAPDVELIAVELAWAEGDDSEATGWERSTERERARGGYPAEQRARP